MNIKEQLIKEIDQIPEYLLSQILDFTLSIKNQSNPEHEKNINQIEQYLYSENTTKKSKNKTQVKAFQDLLENLESIPTDFDVDEVKWEVLKEKYNL